MSGAQPVLLSHGQPSRPCLLWRFPEAQRAIGSGCVGGGIGSAQWVLNAQVANTYARLDPEQHIAEIAAALGCAGPGAGLLTAARVGSLHQCEQDGVLAHATVGVSHPTWAAAPDELAGGDAVASVGTINLVIQMPVHLADAALVGAVITATEAKTQALLEAGIAGTGTATDALCILCPPSGPTDAFAGPRTLWGARLARAVHAAVHAGLGTKP